MTAAGGVVAAATPPAGQTVGPLVRGLALLRTMGEPGRRRMTPGELARATGLSRATVGRLVGTLVALDHLRWDGGAVTLAPPLAALGEAYLTSAQLPRVFAPHLDALAEKLDEPVCLSVPDQDGVRIVAQAHRGRGLAATFLVGDLLPPGRSAAAPLFGPARGAAGPRPPRVGAAAGRFGVDWAVDDQALEPGLIAVAVPVRAPDGRVCGAVTATSQTSRHSLASLCALALPRLRETVAAGERDHAARLAELRAPGRTPLPPPARPDRSPSAAADGPVTAAESVRVVKEELGADFLQSLARGLAVVTAFDADHDRLTLSEVAQRTGLPRATARRALWTLHQLGYVAARGRLFHLLPRLLELGYPALRRLSLAELAQPHLATLAERTGRTATVWVPAGPAVPGEPASGGAACVEEVRCVAHAAGGAGPVVPGRERRPAYATAAGRVLLAGLRPPERERVLSRVAAAAAGAGHRLGSATELDAELRRVRREGHARAEGDGPWDATGALAAPVRDRAGRAVAAVHLAGPGPAGEPSPLAAVRAAADRLGADLRAVGGVPAELAEG